MLRALAHSLAMEVEEERCSISAGNSFAGAFVDCEGLAIRPNGFARSANEMKIAANNKLQRKNSSSQCDCVRIGWKVGIAISYWAVVKRDYKRACF